MSRVSCKDIFMGFRSIVFENKRIFIKKNCSVCNHSDSLQLASWFIVPLGKEWFYERFFFKIVTVMVRDKRKYNRKMQCQ